MNKENLNKILAKCNFSKKILKSPLLYRVFTINNNVKKIDNGIYIVSTEHTSLPLNSNKFVIGLINKLRQNTINSNPVYCSIKPYKWSKGEKFIVIPMGDFYVFQSSIITDLIEVTNIDVTEKLLEIDEPYLAKAIEIAIKDFLFIKSDSFHIIYDDLEKDRKNTLNYFLKTIFSTYSSLTETCYHHEREVLLFCEKYLLLSESLFVQNKLSYEYFYKNSNTKLQK